MDLEEARQTIFAQLSCRAGTEILPLAQARGRITAELVKAQIPLPPFPASAMDGYAVRKVDFEKRTALRVIGASLAGHPYDGTVGEGECVRVFTGAVVPEGADLVVLQERLKHAEEKPDGSVAVTFEQHQPDEDFIRPVGNDVLLGQSLCARGEVLSPLLMGSLAAAGVADICVYKPVTVGVFSSGDELRDPGTPPQSLTLGQIYDSNSFTLASILQSLPLRVVTLDRLPDEANAVEVALLAASKRCDLLITSGGVSVGDADFIGTAIAKLGTLAFWRLNLKPGKPLAFGKIGDCWIFGLPGNPVSTIVTCLLLVLPSLQVLCGTQPSPLVRFNAQLKTSLTHRPGRVEYQRGIYQADELSEGGLAVSHTGDQGSNRLSTFAGANCLIEVPKDSGDIAMGSNVKILLLRDLLA